jgi:NADH-quinone oxidoreductase subunit K
MLLGVSLIYIGFSVFFFEPKGQIFALLILVIAAAESCVGLALLITQVRIKGNTNLSSINNNFY